MPRKRQFCNPDNPAAKELPVEPFLQDMEGGGAAAAGDGRGQRDVLGADLHAVLRVAADLDAPLRQSGRPAARAAVIAPIGLS